MREITKRLREATQERDNLLRQLDERYIAEEFIKSQGLEVPKGKFGMAPVFMRGELVEFKLNGEYHKIKKGTTYPQELCRNLKQKN